MMPLPANAFLRHGSATNVGWRELKIGAGGLITAMDIVSDGTIVCRTDVFGAYIYNRSAPNPGNAGGTGVWQQLVTSLSMNGVGSLGLALPAAYGDGAYEVRIAPSNSSVIYMNWRGWVWVSTNKGVTFNNTGFTRDLFCGGNIGTPRLYKHKMAVDPNDPDDCIIVTPTNGAFETTSGTTTGSWSAISGVAACDSNRIGCVAFDPSSGTTGGRTNVCYIAVSGSGLYKRTTPTGSFSLVSGAPSTQLYDLNVASDGTVYIITSAGALYQLIGTTWTNITPSIFTGGGQTVGNVSVHPTSPGTVYAWSGNNGGAVSTNANTGTVTWTSAGFETGTSPSMTANDCPWLATLYVNTGFFTDGMGCSLFDTLDTTKIWTSANQGVWQISLPVATPAAFTSFNAGIEEVVAQNILVPPGYGPILLGQDIGLIQQTNLSKYPTSQTWPTPTQQSFLTLGSGADYASNNSAFLVALADYQGPEVSAYSSNGGASWTAFPTYPAGGGAAGSIAAASSTEWIWCQATGGGATFHTTNGGSSWGSISGLPSVGFGGGPLLRRNIVCADRVNIGTFYLQNSNGSNAGTWVVSNGGATVTQHANSIDLGFNSTLAAVPGNAGHLFFTSGPQGSGPNPQSGSAGDPASAWPHSQAFYFSHNGGATWTDVSTLGSATILEVWSFGFGAIASGQTYPSIYIIGWVNNVFGVWWSKDNCVTWTQLSGSFPTGWLDVMGVIDGDMNIAGRNYVGFGGSGWAVNG